MSRRVRKSMSGDFVKTVAFMLFGYAAFVLILDLIVWRGDFHLQTTVLTVSAVVLGCVAMGAVIAVPAWLVPKIVRCHNRVVRRTGLFLGVAVVTSIVAYDWHQLAVRTVDRDMGDVKKLVETCISDSWSCSRFTP